MLAAGAIIDERYLIDREVGAGGYGTVYAAFHVALERRVALKLLTLGEGTPARQRADLIERFLEEGRTLTLMRHPNIVSALDFGAFELDGAATPYLAVEWCDGESLERLLARAGPLALAEAVTIFDAVVDALAYAHERGVAHRDVKPANVMMTTGPTGALEPRLIDFGIAKLFEADDAPGTGRTRTASGGSAFTPAYAAPEQIARARTGPWTDVHALGLLFTELITGRCPYGDDDSPGLRAVDPLRPTPAHFGVDVGPLEAVMARALSLRPDARYPNARALQHALRASWRGGEAVIIAPALPSATAITVPAGDATAPPSTRSAGDVTAPPSTQSAGDVTAPPSTQTGARPAPRPGRWQRRALIAVAAAAALAGGTVFGFTRLGPRARTPAPSASASTPAPDSKRACDWPMARLTERVHRFAANPPISLSEREVDWSFSVANDAGDGVHYSLKVRDIAPLPEGEHAGVRAGMEEEIGGFRFRGPGRGVSYGILPDCIALVAGPSDETTARMFDVLLAGAEWEVRGSSVSGADPLGPHKRPPGAARRVRDLTPAECEERARRAGGVLSVHGDADGTTVKLQSGAAEGTLQVRVRAAADALARYRAYSSPPPVAWAIDGDVALVLFGDPPFDATYLEQVLEGLGARVDRHP